MVCVVNNLDLKNFALNWLLTGVNAADFDDDHDVDSKDYSIFADHWLDYCPGGWEL